MLIEIPIKLSEKEILHLIEQKNKITLNRRIQTITGIKKLDLFNYIEENNIFVNLRTCNFCNSLSRFNYEWIFKNNKIYAKFIEYTQESNICNRNDNNITKNCKYKKMNSNSIEFVKTAYGFQTEQEANQFILERNSSPFYKTNYNSEEEYKKQQTRDKEWYEANGKNWDDQRKKMSESHTIESYKEKYGNEEGQKYWYDVQQKKDSSSPEFFKRKYGNNWEKHYKEKTEICTQNLDNFIKRYGKIKGSKKFNEMIDKQVKGRLKTIYNLTAEERSLMYDTNSKQFFKRKYKENWLDEYKKHHFNLQAKQGKQSNESLKFFELLIDKINHLNFNYYIGVGDNKEYFIYDNSNKKLNLYDFTIKEINLIIEFHGSIWHYNPNFNYNKELPFGMLLQENKLKDEYKKNLAIKHGFDYYVVFDTDNYESKQKELSKIIINKWEQNE